MLNQIKKITFMFSFLFLGNFVSRVHAKPVVVHVHGLGDGAENFEQSLVQRIFPDYKLYGNNGPEVKNLLKLNLAQQADIDQVVAACEQALADGEDEIILFGCSKGAATIHNMLHFLHMSKDEKHKKILDAVKVAVTIAPFADIADAEMMAGFAGSLKPIAQRCIVPDRLGVGRACMSTVMKTVFSYNPFGMTPLKSAADMPNVPIFISHSTQDQLIPVNHSRKIYAQLLKKSKLENAYLFEFNGGNHIDSIFGKKNNNPLWQAPMNQFLDKHLVHPADDVVIADHKAQPSIEAVGAKVSKTSVIPSVGYGLLFATCFEVGKYAKHRWDEKNREEMHKAIPLNGDDKKAEFKRAPYQRTIKRSLAYGLAVTAALEVVNQLRR